MEENKEKTGQISNQEIVEVEERTVLEKSSDSRQKLYTILSLLVVSLICVGSILFLLFYTKNTNQENTNLSTATENTTQQNNVNTVPDSINPIDPSKLPLGVNKYSASGPKKGYIYSCQSSFSAGAGGAQVAGPWINSSNKTWDSKQKVSVSGAVKWPNANYKMSINGDTRLIVGNGLPINNQTTGIFPISSSDQAYQYDRNPNSISSQNISWSIPINPTILSV